MEALGAGLSMNPDVFSHHIGMSFKEIEKSTSINKLCETNIGDIPTSIGLYERHKNLQICRWFLGPFQYANVNHAKDHTARNSLLKSIYSRNGVPITISVDMPRTIYVQGYQDENDRTGVVGLKLQTTPWVLQDHILNRRPARQRFADDSMLRDQGERYSQDGLDILQHITIHVTNDSRNPIGQQVLVLFPPSPKLEGDNDVLIFLDSLRKKEHVQSFQEFCRQQEKDSHESTGKQTSNRQPSSQDVEVFANDMLLPTEPHIPKGVERVLHLVRSYALNAWFDRIQSLESQLQDLNVDSFHEHMQDYKRTDQSNQQLKGDGEHRINYGKPDEKWMITAILRYISSLEIECHRLEIDLQAAETSKRDSLHSLKEMTEKYAYIKSRMNSFLAQTRHNLAMKTNKMQNDLTSLYVKESRKSAREAAKVKRILLQARPSRAARLPSPASADTMKMLLERREAELITFDVPEAVLKAGSANRVSGREIVEMLIMKGSPFSTITESIVYSAAKNYSLGTLIMTYLFDHDESIQFTENVLVAAAQIRDEKISVLEFIFEKCPDTPVTECILIAAAAHNTAAFSLLLRRRGDQATECEAKATLITENIVEAVMCNDVRTIFSLSQKALIAACRNYRIMEIMIELREDDLLRKRR
ncbi:hypothetical protein PITC_084310 [Penicillium italicum]|uniref:Uncharacterized protein n=1 Tax=Penicillium italicum TaxID=40296 RepID=A0A0A2L2G1_PENIT|nr:hypothetical protein PITC_084310 [Penicillium italicum]